MTANCPTLKISPVLLTVLPVTPVPLIRNNGDLEDNLEVIIADHTRDRGQLRELIGAERQRESDQDMINRECDERAKSRAEALRAAAQETVKVKTPFWKGLF